MITLVHHVTTQRSERWRMYLETVQSCVWIEIDLHAAMYRINSYSLLRVSCLTIFWVPWINASLLRGKTELRLFETSERDIMAQSILNEHYSLADVRDTTLHVAAEQQVAMSSPGQRSWYAGRTHINGSDNIVNGTAVCRSGRFQRQQDPRRRGLNQRYANCLFNSYIWVKRLCIYTRVGTRHIRNSIQRRKLYIRVGIGSRYSVL